MKAAASPNDSPIMRGRKERVKTTLRWVSLLHGVSDSIAKISSPLFVYELTGGNSAEAAAFFAFINMGMSLAEFVLNPLFGQLSDAYGRQSVLLLWPPLNALSRVAVTQFTTKQIFFAQQVIIKMLEYVFEKGITCAVTDVYDGDERSVALGQINFMREGVGVLVGSLVGGWVAATYGHRAAYALCAAASFGAYALLYFRMVKTHPSEARSPINFQQVMNPFSFLDLFRLDSQYNRRNKGAMRTLSLAFAVQKGTNKGIEQQLNIFTKDQLSWGADMTSKYKIASGFTGMCSGRLVRPVLESVGRQGTVVYGNLFSALAWIVIGTANATWKVFAGISLMLPFGAYKRPVLETAVGTLAEEAKIGQGKMQADLANLVALIKILSPMMYLAAYRWGNTLFNTSSAPFILYAGCFLANAALFYTVPKEKLS